MNSRIKGEPLANDYIDELFVYKVDRIAELGSKDGRTNMIRLDMAAYLRSLVHDGLSGWVEERYKTPLLVLRPEPAHDNPRTSSTIQVPENVKAAAAPITDQTHPPGFFHAVYPLGEFLNTPLGVLDHRAITPRDCILFLSNHLGAVHVQPEIPEKGRKNLRPAHLLRINRQFSIFGNPGVFNFFDNAVVYIFRSLRPLRDEVVETLNTRRQTEN